MITSVITDSLSLGRIDYDKEKKVDNVTIYQYDTWVNLIAIPDLYVNAQRERTTEFLLSETCQYECIDLVDPELIIVQIGVVDCAPRVISRFEKKIMNLPLFPKFIRERIIKSRSKNRTKLTLQNPLKKVYVNLQDFQSNLIEFSKRNSKSKILYIPIIYDESTLDVSFVNNCKLYNEAILEISKKEPNFLCLNVDSILKKSKNFCKDGYHLSSFGHRSIKNKIRKTISSLDK
jgi:acyl-CoA thioesterase-1